MAHKDFGAYEPDEDESGPTFTLNGETFQCLPALPAGAFLELPYGGLTADDSHQFIRRCLVPEDRARFTAHLLQGLDLDRPKAKGKRKPVPFVDAARLYEVTRWLISPDEGGLTPFERARQEQLRGGAAPTGTTSEDESASPAMSSTG